MKIIINGLPISNMRPRLGRSRIYDPQFLVKNVVKNCIRSQMNQVDVKQIEFDVDKGYCVDMTFYFPVAKSLSRAKRMAKLSNREPCLVKNDLDNLEKFYLDCATGILFNDDHQVVSLSSKKLWSELPRVEMQVCLYKSNNEGENV